MSEARENRLQHIRRILMTSPVSGQDELVKMLEQTGFSCTQSSVSRDLADLGISKMGGRYVLPEIARAMSLGVHTAKSAGPNLLVIKTSVGAAQLIGVKIDELQLPQVIGTVAGDDTIFIATECPEDQVAIATAFGVDL